MTVTHFLHAAILVTDLVAAQQFYGEVLGLTPVDRPLSFEGIWYQIGAVQLHLIGTDALMGDRVNEQKWGRNRHLAFAVTDLEALRVRLESCGCAFQRSASGRDALFVADPDGNLIELSQV